MSASRPLKVLVKSPFSIFSGYGNDGFGMLRAFRDWGCEVYPQPTWLDVPVPRDLLPLFGRTLEGPFDLAVNHWDPGHLAIAREARAMTRVAVAWTMWEFAGGPGKDGKGVSGLVPHCEGRSTLRKRLRWYDLVLGYDEVSLTALEPYIPRQVRSGVLQGGFDSREWKPLERDWHSGRFGFVMHGALGARKCPWTAIQAFIALKEEMGRAFADASLALHTMSPGLVFPELNEPLAKYRVKVFTDPLTKDELAEFYRSGHCLLAPSRGEGKNLPALEMLATGGTVAATDFGGHRQWLSGDWAYPLPYTLGPTFERHPWAAHDAKVSVADMKDAIWHIFTHREEARRKGALGAEVIPKMCDWQVVLGNLFRRIRDTVTGPGPEIYDLAMGCRREDAQPGDPAPPPGWVRL